MVNDVGYIIFGVEDKNKMVVGITDVKKSYEEISNRIKTRIEPSIIPIIDIKKIKGKDVIIVKVLPGQNTPYYYVNKGTKVAYIRKGDQDCETNGIEINELILRGKNMGWDEQITDNLYEDFTFNNMKEYLKKIKDYDIDKNMLQSFNLIKNGKLTNAALLFSDQNPVTGSFISFTRWEGLEKIYAKTDKEFYGSILSQIDEAMKYVEMYNSNGWVRQQGKIARTDISEYDLVSIREAIINAVAHRNYLRRGTNIEIGFYDDRIEVVSCGKVEIFSETMDEFLKNPRSERRNQLICDIFARLNYIERRGEWNKKNI